MTSLRRVRIARPDAKLRLAVLKEAGLVQAEREGRSIVYSLDTTVFQELMEEVLAFFDVGGER